MTRIALLHPQCRVQGGAIQMALQAAHALQEQGHSVTLYTFEYSSDCFPDLQEGIFIKIWGKKNGTKLINIITLAFHLRHFDIIIANNPPMQLVAALAKVFSGKKVQTIWWHHHVPWYFQPKVGNTNTKDKVQNTKWWNIIINPLLKLVDCRLKITKCVKSFAERNFVIPLIDQMIATSRYTADCVREYCGREAVVVHPVIQEVQNTEYKIQNDGLLIGSNEGNKLNQLNTVTLFTHGRLEPGKGLDMLVNTFHRMNNEQGIMNNGGSIQLIIFGTGSLETSLREQSIDVRPFRGEETFSELSTGEYGHVIGVYCSTIDAFGMCALESQMAGLSTVILDRGGAREANLSDVSGDPVGYLVDSEDELCSSLSYYIEHKMFPKQMSNVNFSHKRSYFSRDRLSSDLLSIITKIES